MARHSATKVTEAVTETDKTPTGSAVGRLLWSKSPPPAAAAHAFLPASRSQPANGLLSYRGSGNAFLIFPHGYSNTGAMPYESAV